MDELRAPAIAFPDQADHPYAVAHDLIRRRAPKQALDVLADALEVEPRNTGLRILRAWAYLMRAQLQRAEAELRELVDENPDDDWVRHALGRSLERQSRFQEALPHLRLAAAMSGDADHEAAVRRVERELERRA